MFNSVAKYLWGDSEIEQEYKASIESTQNEGELQDFDVQQGEDDWLVVGQSDKENDAHHNNHHHPHSHCHCNHHHQHRSGTLTDSVEPSALQFLFGMSDTELADEASSLEQGSNNSSQASVQHACNCHLNLNNMDLDSNYSSDGESGVDSGMRPSSPESVFSACSGRSHATYQPRGSHRDPWILTPPPCFTGSQAGELSTISSSPLENLLIEHPSMSVYLSLPQSDLPPSHPFHLGYLAALSELQASEANNEGEQCVQADEEQQSRLPTVEERRREVHHRHWGIPAVSESTPEQIVAQIHEAQRAQTILRNKAVNGQMCKKNNTVYDKSNRKNSSKRSKRMCPSGFKSGRISQRV